RRIERDDGTPRTGGAVEDAVHHQRRGLVVELGTRAERLGLESPGHLELAEVAGVDLIERRVARVSQIAAIRPPLAAGRAGLSGGRSRDRGQDKNKKKTSHERNL